MNGDGACAPVDLYRVCTRAPAGQDGFYTAAFNSALKNYETFLVQWLSSDAEACEPRWRHHKVFADEFLTDKALASVVPGSVILVATWTFEMGETIPTESAYFASRILSSPRMWPLLNASQPLDPAAHPGGRFAGAVRQRPGWQEFCPLQASSSLLF